jgi:hypothetical protein
LRDVIAAHTRAGVPTKLDRHGAPHGPDLMVLSYLRGLPRERETNTETADATDEPATRRTALAETRWAHSGRCFSAAKATIAGATLPWSELKVEATRQRCSSADFRDRSGCRVPGPPPPPTALAARAADPAGDARSIPMPAPRQPNLETRITPA